MEGCLIAWNFQPIGTKVELESLGQCTVIDRMNSRYSDPDHEAYDPNRMDLYLGMDVAHAKQWGVKHLAYKLVR